jgi:methionyl aminopeptidase
LELDRIAEEWIRKAGGKPAFKGYQGFPGSICASINEQVVHGIPSATTILKEGDIVSLDVGVLLDGFFGDGAVTLPVGRVSEEARRLLKTTEESLLEAIEKMREGNRLGDVSSRCRSMPRTGVMTWFGSSSDMASEGICTKPRKCPISGVRGPGSGSTPAWCWPSNRC